MENFRLFIDIYPKLKVITINVITLSTSIVDLCLSVCVSLPAVVRAGVLRLPASSAPSR